MTRGFGIVAYGLRVLHLAADAIPDGVSQERLPGTRPGLVDGPACRDVLVERLHNGQTVLDQLGDDLGAFDVLGLLVRAAALDVVNRLEHVIGKRNPHTRHGRATGTVHHVDTGRTA